MTVFGSDGRVRTEEFKPGDAGYVPRGYGHYIENVGDEPLRVLIGFNSGDYQEISLSTWLAANPDAVLADNFKVAGLGRRRAAQAPGLHRGQGWARRVRMPAIMSNARNGQDQPDRDPKRGG